MKEYPSVPAGLVVDHDGPVLQIRLERPERRNAITDDMVLALVDILDVAGSDESVRVIAMSGAGAHFCSGFDLALRDGEERPRVGSVQRRMRTHVNRLVPAMLETQTPIVTRVQGWAIGLGLHLALASDFAIVAEDARLREPFTTFGFTPDSGGSWLLPRLVGVARAKELLLLGHEISGARAAEWGLVHRAVPADELEAASAALVGEVARAATVAVGLAKALVHRGLTATLDAQLADEAFAMEISSRSEDFREYRLARKEQRDPDFRGR